METRIAIVLDASTSMQALTEKTINGLNDYLGDRKADQFKSGDDIKISLLAFTAVREWPQNGMIRDVYKPTWLYRNAPVQDVTPVTTSQYKPNGNTPLYDAIKDVISELNKSACSHNRNFVVIITDGEENSSTATREEVLELISLKKNENWTFVYLGANQDSFKAAGGIGIAPSNIANYGVENTRQVYASMSNVTRGYTSSKLMRSENVLKDSVDASGSLIIDNVDQSKPPLTSRTTGNT